jgi:Flp pilus assembly protein TadG
VVDVGPLAPARSPGRRDDRGTGLLSTSMAVLVFLVMLFFVVQLIVYLHVRSAVAEGALLGAQVLAQSGDAAGAAAAEPDADDLAADLLGGVYVSSWVGNVSHAPDPEPDSYVTFTVEAQAPKFLASAWMGPWARDTIKRSARVRLERMR